MNRRDLIKIGAATSLTALAACVAPDKGLSLLNVSYDPTRELFAAINEAYAQQRSESKQRPVSVQQSHGGSGKQARSVIDGLEADVLSLALAADIDAIAKKAKLLPLDWQSRFANNSCPYTSTIVLLVRAGNPKNIKDWGDLINPGVAVITPNPKTSGGARWNYLAALAWARKAHNGDNEKALGFLKTLYSEHVPVLDTGARGATVTFVERGVGDVLIAWENEAHLAVNKLGKGQFEIVNPSLSILTEPPVCVVDKVAQQKGTLDIANDYIKFLYSAKAQDIIAQNHYRPTNPEIAAQYANRFPSIDMVKIADLGGWEAIQAEHFETNGRFDQISKR